MLFIHLRLPGKTSCEYAKVWNDSKAEKNKMFHQNTLGKLILHTLEVNEVMEPILENYVSVFEWNQSITLGDSSIFYSVLFSSHTHNDIILLCLLWLKILPVLFLIDISVSFFIYQRFFKILYYRYNHLLLSTAKFFVFWYACDHTHQMYFHFVILVYYGFSLSH